MRSFTVALLSYLKWKPKPTLGAGCTIHTLKVVLKSLCISVEIYGPLKLSMDGATRPRSFTESIQVQSLGFSAENCGFLTISILKLNRMKFAFIHAQCRVWHEKTQKTSFYLSVNIRKHRIKHGTF